MVLYLYSCNTRLSYSNNTSSTIFWLIFYILYFIVFYYFCTDQFHNNFLVIFLPKNTLLYPEICYILCTCTSIQQFSFNLSNSLIYLIAFYIWKYIMMLMYYCMIQQSFMFRRDQSFHFCFSCLCTFDPYRTSKKSIFFPTHDLLGQKNLISITHLVGLKLFRPKK